MMNETRFKRERRRFERHRLKFELDDLPIRLARRLPQRATDGTRPITDPDIGGGQFIDPIEAMLTANGCSEDTIKLIVRGHSLTHLSRGYAIASRRLKGTYVVGNPDMTKKRTRRVGVATGNPPYFAYHESMERTLDTYECGYQIIPGAFMTGSTAKDKRLRHKLLDSGLYHVEVLNMGTFKEVQKITVAVFWDHYESHESITLTRAGVTTTVKYSHNDHWLLPYGDVGKELLKKTSPFIGNLTMVQGRGKKPNVDCCVALGEKVAFNQVGWGGRYDRLIAGNVAVLYRNDVATDAMKRFIICNREHALFLAGYLRSIEFNILGSQIAVEKNFTLDLFRRLPMFVNEGEYSSQKVHTLLDAESMFASLYTTLGIKNNNAKEIKQAHPTNA